MFVSRSLCACKIDFNLKLCNLKLVVSISFNISFNEKKNCYQST